MISESCANVLDSICKQLKIRERYRKKRFIDLIKAAKRSEFSLNT